MAGWGVLGVMYLHDRPQREMDFILVRGHAAIPNLLQAM